MSSCFQIVKFVCEDRRNHDHSKKLKKMVYLKQKLSVYVNWKVSDREGHGHKAVLYKSHFPATKALQYILVRDTIVYIG